MKIPVLLADLSDSVLALSVASSQTENFILFFQSKNFSHFDQAQSKEREGKEKEGKAPHFLFQKITK